MKISQIKNNTLPNLSGIVAIFGAGKLGQSLYSFYSEKNKNTFLIDDYLPLSHLNTDSRLLRSKDVQDIHIDHIFLASVKARKRMLETIKSLSYDGHVLIFEGEDDDIFAPYKFINRPEIRRYKNVHKNESAYIIGNGPSLNKTDPRLIKKGVTFAANAIYLLEGFKPDYHFCDDIYIAEQRANEINDLDWVKFYPADQEKWLKNANYFNGKRVPWISKFSDKFDEYIELNATVSYTMIQMAYFMGCNPVYLIGMDHDYTSLLKTSDQNGNTMISNSEDKSHFHKNYFSKGMKWHYPWMKRIEAAFLLAHDHFTKNERKLFNATDGGNLNIFPRISFKDALDQNK